jgi:hypothetical protein
MKFRFESLLLAVMLLPLSAVFCQAADAAANNQLLCAITEVIECDALGKCAELSAEEVGLADFLTVDLDAKKVREATTVSLRESSFNTHSPVEGVTILSGVDGLRGWSAVLSAGNTRMTASVSDESAAFVLFGHCMATP